MYFKTKSALLLSSICVKEAEQWGETRSVAIVFLVACITIQCHSERRLIFADVFLSEASCEFKKSSIDMQPTVYYDILPALLHH